ncbi:MAG: hypothetical protein SVX43_11280 [Cyanobacteriota bacterium]|nr:hypothetical protein [Cyanobacteriota bacterium]
MKTRLNQVLVGGIAGAIAIAAATPPSFGYTSWNYTHPKFQHTSSIANTGDLALLPPASMEVMYEVLPSSLITSILDFPCGLDTDDLFTVSVGGIELGQFQPSDQLIFSEFAELLNGLLIDGIGVESLVISDIDIPVKLKAHSTYFYGKLVSNTPVVSVRVTQVPEPSAGLGVFTLAGLGIVAQARRNK